MKLTAIMEVCADAAVDAAAGLVNFRYRPLSAINVNQGKLDSQCRGRPDPSCIMHSDDSLRRALDFASSETDPARNGCNFLYCRTCHVLVPRSRFVSVLISSHKGDDYDR